jgi:hypothetical protein
VTGPYALRAGRACQASGRRTRCGALTPDAVLDAAQVLPHAHGCAAPQPRRSARGARGCVPCIAPSRVAASRCAQCTKLCQRCQHTSVCARILTRHGQD